MDKTKCPFCGNSRTQPILNLDIFTCNRCISYSGAAKTPGVSGFIWNRSYCIKAFNTMREMAIEYDDMNGSSAIAIDREFKKRMNK